VSDRLLNTAEAATYLRVSQASVRRWSDSGLLQARRVGRRKERRFREADLIDFLSQGSSSHAPRRATAPGGVMIGGTHVALHNHLATFYISDESRLRLTIPFFREGLVARQPCFLMAEGHVLDAYVEAVRGQDGIDLDAAIRDQLFTTAPGPGSSVQRAL
jgi:excisionase family DNA binding protein